MSFVDKAFYQALEDLMLQELFHAGKASSDISRVFTYEPLTGSNDIRILTLEPGNFDDDLKGTLEHVSLDGSPEYDALSYSWGAPEKRHVIHLPQGRIHITDSLHIALLHLRHDRIKRRLWVDALCINQTNNSEKADQILRMPRIYSTASMVVIWLGTADRGGKEALQLLRKIDSSDFTDAPFGHLSDQWVHEKGLPPKQDPLWYNLSEFWQRPWFRRAWVVQELVMAQEAVFMCGYWLRPWRDMRSPLEKMVEYGLLSWGTMDNMDEGSKEAGAGSQALRIMFELKCRSNVGLAIANLVRSFSERDESGLAELEGEVPRSLPFVKDAVLRLRAAPHLKDTALDMIEDAVNGVMETSDMGQVEPSRFSLVNILTLCDNTEATEPRDRLFALLGLSDCSQSVALRPSYDDPLEDVLIRYGREFVRRGDGIRMLCQAGNDPMKSAKVPSWIPDWSRTGQLKRHPLSIMSGISMVYAASSDAVACLRLTDIQEQLVALGSYVGCITRIIEMADPHNTDGTVKVDDTYLQDMRDFFTASDQLILSQSAYITGEPLVEVQWRTLIANLSDRPATASSEYGAGFAESRAALNDPERYLSDPHQLPSYLHRYMSLAGTYALCQLDRGLFGLVPKVSRVGDAVFLVAGSPLPFTFRSSSKHDGWYELVGSSYIHGVMNGEAKGYGLWEDVDIHIC